MFLFGLEFEPLPRRSGVHRVMRSVLLAGDQTVMDRALNIEFFPRKKRKADDLQKRSLHHISFGCFSFSL